MTTSICPLCANPDIWHFHRDPKRDYYRCPGCLLVFVLSQQHLSLSQEKAIYDLHHNTVGDPGYTAFLSRLATPLLARIPENSVGLDFGCGPGPALAALFTANGHTVHLYDPFYANHPEQLQQAYTFVLCTEVVEHFRNPKQACDRLLNLVEPGGWLGIMTKLVIDADAFAKWHYKNDPTHVAFFSRPTFDWLASQYGCQLEFIGNDVIILRRSPTRCSDSPQP